MTGLRIEGSDDLQRVADALKAAGDGGLQKAVSGSIRAEARPLGLRVLRLGAAEMPRRGGLSARVAAGSAGVSSSLRGRVASVTVVLRNKGIDLKAMDAGVVRHPAFARADRDRVWVRQSVPEGAFRRAFAAEATGVRSKAVDAAQGVLNDVARKA